MRLYRPSSPEIARRAQEHVGTPFLHLPGNPPAHQVLGELTDGTKVRANALEMVYNDMLLIDHCVGDGAYEKINHDDPRQLAVLDMARRLYASGVN